MQLKRLYHSPESISGRATANAFYAHREGRRGFIAAWQTKTVPQKILGTLPPTKNSPAFLARGTQELSVSFILHRRNSISKKDQHKAPVSEAWRLLGWVPRDPFGWDLAEQFGDSGSLFLFVSWSHVLQIFVGRSQTHKVILSRTQNWNQYRSFYGWGRGTLHRIFFFRFIDCMSAKAPDVVIFIYSIYGTKP